MTSSYNVYQLQNMDGKLICFLSSVLAWIGHDAVLDEDWRLSSSISQA